MMGIGRRLVELDDDIHRGATRAAFQGFKVLRHLALVAVGKGQSGSQQDDQRQEREPRAPHCGTGHLCVYQHLGPLERLHGRVPPNWGHGGDWESCMHVSSANEDDAHIVPLRENVQVV